ncbi:hypothetical protein CXG81DRAFT_23727 [Caulochytrium protostelioides]|uniref:Pentacotripeptide-repeat region of PRORP domain-containing protein n=1 Tax=Caulochytrium protostelioides TaxID=1555241 RepID=A0A4P9XDP6_9FUNG|nr:hypothetical protein CXG81DRAFT_23727 [Caulochytrium protostelioides]|eukprot:RKP03615.1 hypothetical protein CXG81DRAFT_23727 [Caulochytrium protostelioides]
MPAVAMANIPAVAMALQIATATAALAQDGAAADAPRHAVELVEAVEADEADDVVDDDAATASETAQPATLAAERQTVADALAAALDAAAARYTASTQDRDAAAAEADAVMRDAAAWDLAATPTVRAAATRWMLKTGAMTALAASVKAMERDAAAMPPARRRETRCAVYIPLLTAAVQAYDIPSVRHYVQQIEALLAEARRETQEDTVPPPVLVAAYARFGDMGHVRRLLDAYEAAASAASTASARTQAHAALSEAWHHCHASLPARDVQTQLRPPAAFAIPWAPRSSSSSSSSPPPPPPTSAARPSLMLSETLVASVLKRELRQQGALHISRPVAPDAADAALALGAPLPGPALAACLQVLPRLPETYVAPACAVVRDVAAAYRRLAPHLPGLSRAEQLNRFVVSLVLPDGPLHVGRADAMGTDPCHRRPPRAEHGIALVWGRSSASLASSASFAATAFRTPGALSGALQACLDLDLADAAESIFLEALAEGMTLTPAVLHGLAMQYRGQGRVDKAHAVLATSDAALAHVSL